MTELAAAFLSDLLAPLVDLFLGVGSLGLPEEPHHAHPRLIPFSLKKWNNKGEFAIDNFVKSMKSLYKYLRLASISLKLTTQL
jgi:hypothetical protein